LFDPLLFSTGSRGVASTGFASIRFSPLPEPTVGLSRATLASRKASCLTGALFATMPPHDDATGDTDAGPVVFAVPPDLRSYAPDGADAIAVDPVTLVVRPAGPAGAPDGDGADGREDAVPDEAAPARIHPSFPSGRAGVATALLLAKLDSIAHERPAAVALVDEAEAAGGDVLLTLARLADAADDDEATLDPSFDVERRRRQLAQFLDL
jgi:hypothetical protein